MSILATKPLSNARSLNRSMPSSPAGPSIGGAASSRLPLHPRPGSAGTATRADITFRCSSRAERRPSGPSRRSVTRLGPRPLNSSTDRPTRRPMLTGRPARFWARAHGVARTLRFHPPTSRPSPRTTPLGTVTSMRSRVPPSRPWNENGCANALGNLRFTHSPLPLIGPVRIPPPSRPCSSGRPDP